MQVIKIKNKEVQLNLKLENCENKVLATLITETVALKEGET